ncbi:hypothetical protein CKAH01_03280 [Colletotrichum kahawae]|uniref:Uncharacterized protein n=1 Tax=Colletotrichum kahawae TaxID=34407 RepID=A0AAD9YTS9_COLKA|nr:hypothetical protein CKAH01_03280 [Colletotrichum kahawae]
MHRYARRTRRRRRRRRRCPASKKQEASSIRTWIPISLTSPVSPYPSPLCHAILIHSSQRISTPLSRCGHGERTLPYHTDSWPWLPHHRYIQAPRALTYAEAACFAAMLRRQYRVRTTLPLDSIPTWRPVRLRIQTLPPEQRTQAALLHIAPHRSNHPVRILCHHFCPPPVVAPCRSDLLSARQAVPISIRSYLLSLRLSAA